MRNITKFTTALLTLAVAAPAIANAKSADTDRLVYKVRTEAAFKGVEVERIQRNDQTLRVLGHDRQGREVAMTMECADLGFTCESAGHGTFAAVAN